MEKSNVTDDLLCKALARYSNQLIEECEKRCNVEHKFSKRFEFKMKILIMKYKLKEIFEEIIEFQKNRKVRIFNAGVALAAICIMLLVYFDSAKAMASPNLAFETIEVAIDGGVMLYSKSNTSEYNIELFKLGYLPKGYSLEKSIEDENSLYAIYKNAENEHIIWRQYFANENIVVSLNSENIEIVKEEYRGEEIEFRFHISGHTTMYYESGNRVYILEADNLSKKEIYKILDGIEPVK